jgi:hypothetical protein
MLPIIVNLIRITYKEFYCSRSLRAIPNRARPFVFRQTASMLQGRNLRLHRYHQTCRFRDEAP